MKECRTIFVSNKVLLLLSTYIMKNTLLLCLFFFSVISCTGNRSAKFCNTYQEAADPDSAVQDWSRLKGLQVSFGDIDTRYAKSRIPDISPIHNWEGSGWRGETVSAQVLLWSATDIHQVECEFSDFKSAEGFKLESSVAQARFVRYVLTDIFKPGCGYRKPEDFPVSLVADGLDNMECFDLQAETVLPVWVTFNIPADAQPGLYHSRLRIYSRDNKAKELSVSLEVLPQTLPEPADWKFHLDLWQHPCAVARVNNVKPWSEEHWSLLEIPMKMLADAGQKVITATLNKDPWNVQTFDPYEDMISWTLKKDGSWKYNYNIFDRWINLMMGLGINKQINCYSMVPWNNEIHYMDEKSGELVNVSVRPGTDEFNRIWSPFLLDFRDHMQQKGWLPITNIAMDERSPEDMKAAIGLLSDATPEFGIALADNHKSYKEYPMLKDICLAFGETFDLSDLEFRKQNGLVSTWYVCCSDKFPNVFTFSDPAEAAYIGWYSMAAGFDGFLRWAYNSWTENPLIDSRFRTWPAGDTYIIYPNGRSSIRFERLKEGIQDAEKIRILRKKFTAGSDFKRLELLENTLRGFNIHRMPDQAPSEMLHRAKAVLVALSREDVIEDIIFD